MIRMGSIGQFTPVKLFTGVLVSNSKFIPEVEHRLSTAFGPIDHRSDIIPFDFTDYYEAEMGDLIDRKFFSFARLIEADRLAEIKRETNRLESEMAPLLNAVKRPVNLDPGYIEHAKDSSAAEVLTGGDGDKSDGYFIPPTVVVTTDPRFKLMREEIFGPVLTVFVYDDLELESTLELVDTTSPYALTGAIFAEDRKVIAHLTTALRHAAGNFYINDKPTGAVVGQQPFGGARASGTNDKAGSMANLLRWTSQRAIKENFVPPKEYRYPHMEEK